MNIKNLTSRLRGRTVSIALVSLVALTSINAAALGGSDADGDGVLQGVDNCLDVANSLQRDTDGDGIGNACDPDLDQSCVINFSDIAIFSSRFLSSDEDADFDGDGTVNFIDYAVMVDAFLAEPGPSGIANVCSDQLSLSGVVGFTAIDAPEVVVQVDSGAVGGGVSEYITTAQADGSYSVDIAVVNDQDFVTVLANGVGGQSFVAYKSLAGSVGLLSAAGGNDGTVNSNEVTALDVTSLTTAYETLAKEANGSPIVSDSSNNQIAKLVDSSLLLRLAAVLESVVVDFGLQLPSGFADMAALIADAEQRENFEIFTSVNFQSTYENSIQNILLSSSAEYDATELPQSLYTVLVNNLFQNVAGQVTFESGTFNAEYSNFNGTFDVTWIIGGDGSLILTPPSPAVMVTFPDATVEDPANPGTIITTTQQQLLDQVIITRFRQGAIADHVTVTETVTTAYPDIPTIPSVTVEQVAAVETARVSVTDSATEAFFEGDLTADGLALDYYHVANNSEGSNNPNRGFDVLEFMPDGTGSTTRRGFAFDWLINVNGELEVTFANGDVNRYTKLINEETGVAIAVSTSSLLGTAGPGVIGTRLVTPTTGLSYDTAGVELKTFRHALATTDTLQFGNTVFDFVISNDNTACRNPDSPSSDWTWEIVTGRLELFRTFSFDPAFFFYRTWQPIRENGNRRYVVETLQTNFEPDVVPVNVAETPGRLNMYTLVHDAAGNTRPILNDDSFSTTVDTPINILLTDIISNDVDAEMDEILWRSQFFLSGSAGGSIQGEVDDSITAYNFVYTPPPGFIGTETFEYSASDIACRGELPPTAIISINVN